MIRHLLATALTLTGALTISPTQPTAAALDDTPWRVPAPPPRCTTAQADSGDVAGCLLLSYAEPSDTGWGTPPAPGVGAGWTWNGYTYNGSPALADWESTYIATNTQPVAGFGPGYLDTHRFAQPLFEGFLNEISTNGYRVLGVGGYTFRCTSGSGGWSCPSGDPAGLSNHAWGLAIDMNAGTNPIRSYSGINGATACQTPIQTDLPRWVIETAERWGLYWGGYGWSTGCQTVDTYRASVTRDPPHFEFRGTPEQAQAIAAFNLRNDPRQRCWVTVSDAGENVERCNLTGIPQADWRLPVDSGAPPEAVAAMINLTAVQPATAGHLTLESCAPMSGPRSTSSVNFGAGETAAAMAIVPLDPDGRFCVHRMTDVHTVVDVVGFLTDAGERMWLEPASPARLLDTRIDCEGEGCVPARVGDLDQRVVPTDLQAPRLVNLTIADALGPGHARVGRCDLVDTADVSSINYVAGGARANLALMDEGPDGACAWVHRETHVIVDELATLDAATGMGWLVDQPRRVLDTRLCTEAYCDGMPVGGEGFAVDLGIDSPGAAVTLTITNAQGPGHAWIGACDELVDGQPTTSNVNYVPGKATANMAILIPDGAPVCAFVHASAHVVVDIQAELVAGQTIGLTPVTPYRVHDSRVDTI